MKLSMRGVSDRPSRSLTSWISSESLLGLIRVIEQPDQELPDLSLVEGLEMADTQAGDELGLLEQGHPDLLVRLEVVRPAGNHDLGLSGRRLEEGLEMVRGALVADALGQLVEAVEQKRDPALLQHEAKLLDIERLFAPADEVLGDQLVERPGELERPQLDQDRDRCPRLIGQPAGQLPQQERLARAEVRQDQDEPSVVLHQPSADDLDGIVVGLLLQDRRPGPEPGRHPLLDIEARRVDPVGLQPLPLTLQVMAEVDQPLVLDEGE